MTPHDGVYTRIKPSPLHGVGVFAILDIPKGTALFPLDDDPMVEIEKALVDNQTGEIRRLYNDFCILEEKGLKYKCPTNFSRMTIAWYLNDSREPNVICDAEYRFFTFRNINAGEELTVDYSTYSNAGI